MSNYAREFRRLMRLSIASLSIASLNCFVAPAEAQQPVTGFADALVLPAYYPGMGRVMVLGGIESARPIASKTVSHTQLDSPPLGGSETSLTVQATAVPDQPNQIKVIVLQQPLVPQQATGPQQTTGPQVIVPQIVTLQSPQPAQQPVEPNRGSQLERRIAPQEIKPPRPREAGEVQPLRDPPQLRREQPRDVQGPLNPTNRDQPNRDQPNRGENRGSEERRAPGGDSNRFREDARNASDRPGSDRPQGDRPQSDRPESNRGPDRDQAANRRGPGFGGPGFGNPGFNPGQGPWMRGGMDGGPNNSPNNGPNNGPGHGEPNNGPGHDLDSLDRIFSSPAVRQFLQLKEENLQLKAELKVKEREFDMKMEMTDLRLRMHMEEAEKRVHQANQQLEEMKSRAGGREQAAARAEAVERAESTQRTAHRESAEADAKHEHEADRAESQRSLERVTQERNRVVAELEKVLKQNIEMKRKFEVFAQEKANIMEKSIDAQRMKADAKKTEMKKEESTKRESAAKKEEVKREKPANRKLDRDEAGGHNDDDHDHDHDEKNEGT